MLKHNLMKQITHGLNQAMLNHSTQQKHLHWIRAFLRFNQFINPQLLNASDVQLFIHHRGSDNPAGQQQRLEAMSALTFLYQQILGKPLRKLEITPSSLYQASARYAA